MDSIGGINPSEPKPNAEPTPNNSPIPRPIDINSGAPSADIAPASPPSAATNLSDFKFDEPETPSVAQPHSSVNPTVGGTAPVINQTVKPVVKAAKVKQPVSGGAGKKVLLTLLALVLIVAAGVGGYFYGQTVGRDKTLAEVQRQKDEAAASAANGEEAEEDAPVAGELILGELRDPIYADETLTAEVGKQIEANDGLVMKVVSVERNFQTTDPNYKIETGKELIKVNLALGNVAKDKAKDITPSSFRLVNSAGTKLTGEVIASFNGKFETLKIEPGKQTTGSIVYKVEKDEKPLSLEREQRYRIATDNKEVTTKITITLTK